MLKQISFFLCAVIFVPLAGSAQDAGETPGESQKHVNYYDLPWTNDPGIPLAEVARWRTLLGTGGAFGEGLPDKDLYIRQGEMGPGAIYPDHQHPSAEFWYFIAGRAKWTVDGEEFEVEPGSAVYLQPNSIRSVEIISKDKAVIARGNWGVNCNRDILFNTSNSGQPGSVEENRGYVWAGEHTYATYPQPEKARLPVWEYGDSRRPVEGSKSNLALPASATSEVHLKHLNLHDLRFPPDPTGVRHWITLVGSGSDSWGTGLPNNEILWGVGELGSGGIYDDHHHAWPEMYHFVSGRAIITVDGDEFEAEPGEMIYHKPWAMHRSEIISAEKAVVMWANWTVECDRSVLSDPYKVLGEFPKQPASAILLQ